MIVDRTALVVQVLLIAAALYAVIRTGRRATEAPSMTAGPRPRSAAGRFLDLLTIAMWFGLVTGAMHVLLALIDRYLRHRILMAGPQMFWMTPAADALIFAAIGLVLAAVASLSSRIGFDTRAFAVFAGLGVFDLLLPFPQLHKAAAALIAIGVGRQAGRAMAARPEWWLSHMRRSAVRFALFLLVVAIASALRPIAAERYALARLPAAPVQTPNVLLIVLDTVRAESLSLYGYARPTTPGLERLARESTTFDFAMSTAPWTLKSHGSMFTGLYPEEIPGDFEHPLDFPGTVLAEEFRDHGYLTGGFVGNIIYTSRESGLSRGFVHYDDYRIAAPQVIAHSWIGQTPLVRNVAKSQSPRDLWQALIHAELSFDSNDFNRKTYERRPAGDIAAAFLDWQSANSGRPFFAFLNFFDAHYAYRSPREFERRFVLPDQPSRGLYDGAIAYLDSEIDRLLNELRRRNALDNTVVVITSDHGEHFGEHGLILHANSLYTQLLHVPLLIRYPARVPAGTRVENVVTLRDLAATIVELTGLAGARFPGTSLASQWAPAVPSQGSAVSAELSNVVRPEPSSPAAFGRMRSLFDREFHYIRRGDGAEELFDYRADPAESSDLSKSAAGAARIAEFRRLLESRPPGQPAGR